MRNWEIYKDRTRKELEPIKKQTKADNARCTALHKRVGTRAEGLRIVREMRRQGIPCVVSKRGV